MRIIEIRFNYIGSKLSSRLQYSADNLQLLLNEEKKEMSNPDYNPNQGTMNISIVGYAAKQILVVQLT